MDSKNMRELTIKDLDKVNGGTEDTYDPNGPSCPICGSRRVRLLEDRGSSGLFCCDYCDFEFQDDK